MITVQRRKTSEEQGWERQRKFERENHYESENIKLITSFLFMWIKSVNHGNSNSLITNFRANTSRSLNGFQRHRLQLFYYWSSVFFQNGALLMSSLNETVHFTTQIKYHRFACPVLSFWSSLISSFLCLQQRLGATLNYYYG